LIGILLLTARYASRSYKIVFFYHRVEFGGKTGACGAIRDGFFEFLKKVAVHPMSMSVERLIPYRSPVSLFAEWSPPLHPFWQFRQLWERVNKPFSRRCVAQEIVDGSEELNNVRIDCEGSFPKDNAHYN
jgi:hypothetical protein